MPRSDGDPILRFEGSKFRWREDGGDLHTGSNRLGGTGGYVAWKVNPWRYTAYAYSGKEEYERDFKHQASAQRAVERWLTKHQSKVKNGTALPRKPGRNHLAKRTV